MFGLPLHPAIVHLPLGIAMALPLVVIGVTLSRPRAWLGRRTWWLAVMLSAVVLASAGVALRSGEDEEERVEDRVGKAAIHEHEERAEQFTFAAGATLLLHAEQGTGDSFQFARYAPLARARGARVVLEVHPTAIPVLGSLAGVARLIPHGQPLPPFDIQAPLMSLPRIFATTLANVPATVPYDQVALALAEFKNDLLEAAELASVYQGDPIPAGKKSVAISARYRSESGSLTDAKIDAVHQRLIDHLVDRLGAERR